MDFFPLFIFLMTLIQILLCFEVFVETPCAMLVNFEKWGRIHGLICQLNILTIHYFVELNLKVSDY